MNAFVIVLIVIGIVTLWQVGKIMLEDHFRDGRALPKEENKDALAGETREA